MARTRPTQSISPKIPKFAEQSGIFSREAKRLPLPNRFTYERFTQVKSDRVGHRKTERAFEDEPARRQGSGPVRVSRAEFKTHHAADAKAQ